MALMSDNFRRNGILVDEPLMGYEITPPGTPEEKKEYHVIGMPLPLLQ
jgi:predicted alpha/beta-hydrolase family hydrolase